MTLTGPRRLLSAAGIPKLRRIAKDKSKLRFNGKGNEVCALLSLQASKELTQVQFTDMARLLNTYQLWLDDLFPKAKFLDGLTMIEKLGHKKKIQLYRKEWIDEGKPKSADDELDDFLASREERESERRIEEALAQEGGDVVMAEQQQGSANDGPSAIQRHATELDEPDEDELDALMEEVASNNVQKPGQRDGHVVEDQGSDEDELDALLGEPAPTSNEPKSLFGGPQMPAGNSSTTHSAEDFADEEEAMAGMEW